jgi:arsenate reductase
MAQAILNSFDPCLEVYSAGTDPAKEVHPLTIEVMKEIDFDLSRNIPETVEKYLDKNFDYVITVCDEAKENCPVFLGNVKTRLHIGFEDPAAFDGPEEQKRKEFRKIRDQIKRDFKLFYDENLSS